MAIKLVTDVVPPVVVAAVDIVVGSQPTMAPYADYIAYGMAGLGYVGAFMNFGGDFVKNLGIAALPDALKRLYALVTVPAPASRPSRVAFNPGVSAASGRMASSRQEFANIRLG